MATIKYKIEFFTYWHTGSGLSGGTAANARLIRNTYDLPYIPGKTIKGLLREAAEKITNYSEALVSKEFLKEVFGTGEKAETSNSDKKWTEPSICFFSNAELSNELTKKLSASKQQKWLYDIISSTAMEDKNALRSIEVSVPLILFAQIDDFPENTQYQTELINCFKWVKRLGVNRNRGLGRCQWTLI